VSDGRAARRGVRSVEETGTATTRVLVINPRARAAVSTTLWQRALTALREDGVGCVEIETRPDETNARRVADLIDERRPATVIAAGGDGTVSEVAQAVLEAHVVPAPALAILPMGTANNVARSIGLRSCRRDGQVAIDLAVATARGRVAQPVDVGTVETRDGHRRYFIGSFALGMDAHILLMRNRLRRRLALGQRTGGYPLYLLSCALCLLSQRRAVVSVRTDDVDARQRLYNLLVLNTPLYAGEFRFGGTANLSDGLFELQRFSGPIDYVRQFVAAWRRHLRYSAGRTVKVPRGQHHVREVHVELESPLPAQLDGEEFARSVAYTIRVVPRALMVRRGIPSPATRAGED